MDLSQLYGPGYAGYLQGMQSSQDRNMRALQGMGMLSGMQRQQEESLRAAQMAPLQMEALRAQVQATQAQAAERDRKAQFYSPENMQRLGILQQGAPAVMPGQGVTGGMDDGGMNQILGIGASESGAPAAKPETGPSFDLDRLVTAGAAAGVIPPETALNIQAQRQARQDALQARLLELNMRSEDKALDRASREEAQRQALQLQAMIAQGNQAIQGMAAQTARMGLDMRRDDLEYRRAQDLKSGAIRGASDLSSALDKENFPGLLSTTRTLNDTLGRYSPTDVPGVGYAKNLGMANFFLSPEGKVVKSQVQAVANDLLKLYSGGAVTMNEGERRTVEQMSSGAFSAQDLYNAWPTVVNRVNSVAGNRTAGVTPAALEEYSRRPGALKLDPITPTRGRQGPAQQSGVTVRTPDGQTFTFNSQREADNFRRDAGIR
jgi:hypothetical protein